MNGRPLSLATVALAVLAAWSAIVALAAYAGLGGRYSLHPDDPDAVPAPPALNLSAARIELPAYDTRYAVIGERPLFSPDRRPLPDSDGDAVDAVEAPPPAPLDVTLTSVILFGEARLAMVMDNKTKTSQTVRVGDSLGGEQAGWKLVELAPRRAVFEGPTGRSEADLRVFDGQGGQPPTAITTPQPAVVQTGEAQPGEAPAQPATQASSDAAQPDQLATPDGKAGETPQSRAEMIRRRIEERRRQMREEAARANGTNTQ